MLHACEIVEECAFGHPGQLACGRADDGRRGAGAATCGGLGNAHRKYTGSTRRVQEASTFCSR